MGNHYLQKYKVNAKDTIQSFANVGCKVQAKVLGWPDIGDEDQSDIDDEDDLDSVLGTQSVFGDTSKHNDISGNSKDNEPASWTSAKEKLIPAYVKRVTFTVNEEDMTPIRYTELKNQFPDVLIQSISPSADGKPNSSEVEKPNDVKTATFLLDQAEIDKDPALTNKLANQFPWATLQEANKHAPQPIEKDTSPTQPVPLLLPLPGPRRSLPHERYVPRPDKDIIELAMSDPMNHLRNLATFVVQSPTDLEFGFKFQIAGGWDGLLPTRKADIAHARCIQRQYGEATPLPCTSCTNRGYACRTYRGSFTPLPGIDLGHGCQNCRVWGQPCDLPPPAAIPSTTETSSNPSNQATPQIEVFTSAPTLDRVEPNRAESGNPSANRDIVTRSPTVARKPSLIECMSRLDETQHEPDLRIGGAAISSVDHEVAEDQDEDEDQMIIDNSTAGSSDATPPRALGSHGPRFTVQSVADDIGLKIQFPDLVQGMYDNYISTWKISGKGKLNVDTYYTNLLDLCIVAKHAEKHTQRDRNQHSVLEDKVVMKWQETDYRHVKALPDISTAIKAFQWVPDSALCSWITIMYSFLWTTRESGDYQGFRKDLDQDLESNAIANFLYTIAWTRCPYTKGNDLNVLPLWCDVHKHPRDGHHEERCIEFRDMISHNLLATQQQKQVEEDLEEAKNLIAEHNGHAIMKTDPPLRKAGKAGKRKSDVVPEITEGKRTRSSSGYGRGRGSGR